MNKSINSEFYNDPRTYMAIESTFASWIRNMFDLVAAGIITYSLILKLDIDKRFIYIPLILIAMGIILGAYSTYSYNKKIRNIENKEWTYDLDNFTNLSIVICLIELGFLFFIIKTYTNKS